MDSPTHDVPFTVNEAAAFWKVAKTTVRNWIKWSEIQPIGWLDQLGNPWVYRFGDLSAAERKYRTSVMGAPRSKDRTSRQDL